MLRGLALIAAIIGAAQAAPCDIYAKAGTPCVAAHSTVRAMFSEYKGPLYQVQRTSDKKTTDVKPLKAGGIANAATQDKFCKHERCVISILYDQSGKGNHLTPAPGGGFITTPDDPANAAQHPIMVNGKKAYGVWIDLGMGYRNNNTTDIPVGDEAEAIYMLASGLHFNKGCCFDYGNAETTNNNDGSATMEALYLGSAKAWNFGPGAGPWVMADLENGVYGSNVTDLKHECPNLEPVSGLPYVTAMLKGRSGGTYALKQGNGQYGKLKTTYDGPRPTGYTVMKKQGGILLGIGGDNSNSGNGTFYEGALIKGNPSDSVDDQVQADIVAARYATPVTLPPPPMQKPKLNDMCGGNAYAGLTECAEGVCVELNEWNWRCQLPDNTTAPVTTAPASSVPVTTAPAALAKLYEQCGGKLWTGATKCVQGAECKFFNDWFSQCVPVSPNQTPAL